jgi:hypothetical protein
VPVKGKGSATPAQLAALAAGRNNPKASLTLQKIDNDHFALATEEMLPQILEAQPHLSMAANGAALYRYAVILTRIMLAYKWLGTRANPLLSHAQRGTAHRLWADVERWESAADRMEAMLAITPSTRARYGFDLVKTRSAADDFEAKLRDKEKKAARKREKDAVEGKVSR